MNNKNLKFALLICLFAYLLICLLPFSVHAQTVKTMTITPPTISVTLKPGDRSEGVLGVINQGDSPLSFSATVQDFVVNDTIGTPNILPPNTLSNKYSAASWIGVSPSVFTVAPHSRQEINYYVQIPSTARPGGHYAAIIYTPVNPNTLKQQTGASVNTEIGTLFLITIPGSLTELSTVTKFLANVFQEYGPVVIATQIKNFGDLHIRPMGNITVTNLFGQTVYSQQFEEHNIFPGAARDFTTSVGSRWMFGRYKAMLLAAYGTNGNLPLTATVYFWVIPWRVSLVIILIIIAAILGFMVWKKKKKISHKDEETPMSAETPKQEEVK